MNNETGWEKIPWQDYLDRNKKTYLGGQWIVDYDGLKWDYDYSELGYNHRHGLKAAKRGFCRAKNVEDDAYVIVADGPSTDPPDLASFSYEFYDLVKVDQKGDRDYDLQKTIDFMLRWRFDRVGILWLLEDFNSIVFTVEEVWAHQDDFSDNFTYFGLKEDFLPAEIYLEQVNKEIENLAQREGTRAHWGKSHSGRLDEINNHLGRMDPELILQKNDGGEAIYQDSMRDRDLVALAYHQLYKKLTSVAKGRKLKRCLQCDGILDPTNIRQSFCRPACRRSHHNHKYHEKKKQNPV